mmetsp:Transcript_84871/g.226897  ORF Transcript_84871/g.226897 Transcript_84871/m.226897 type:complete len:255 (-) Transcript_84871:356-1120(-)
MTSELERIMAQSTLHCLGRLSFENHVLHLGRNDARTPWILHGALRRSSRTSPRHIRAIRPFRRQPDRHVPGVRRLPWTAHVRRWRQRPLSREQPRITAVARTAFRQILPMRPRTLPPRLHLHNLLPSILLHPTDCDIGRLSESLEAVRRQRGSVFRAAAKELSQASSRRHEGALVLLPALVVIRFQLAAIIIRSCTTLGADAERSHVEPQHFNQRLMLAEKTADLALELREIHHTHVPPGALVAPRLLFARVGV